MIEISKRNGNWEAYFQGGLMEWHSDLETLLQALARHAEEIEEATKEDEES